MSLSKNINPSLVLVQPRKTRPYITERLLMGRKESNQKLTGHINDTCRLVLVAHPGKPHVQISEGVGYRR